LWRFGADMAWFRHLKIGQKFFVSFGLLLLLLGLSLAAILFYLARINSYVERHERITVPALVMTVEIRKRIVEMTSLQHALARAESDGDRQGLLDQLQRLDSETHRALASYRTTHAAKTHPVLFRMLTRHGKASLADLEEKTLESTTRLLTAYGVSWKQADRRPAKSPARSQNALRETDALARRLTDQLETLIDIHTKITTEMKTEGDALFRQAELVILALVVSLGVLIVAIYALVNAQIANPLKRLAETADRVAHHDLAAGFDPWPARDEVGTLSQSLRTMVGHLRDRTGALERKTRELEGFTYSVAHDLKSPLREIEGFSSLIQAKSSDTLDPTIRHYLSKIRTSALRLTALINDLLRYSRLELQSLPMIEFDVRALIDGILKDRLPVAGTPSPVVTVDLPFTHLRGEPTSVQQALINLIGNALKFSRMSKPSELTISGTLRGHEQILSVRDNGIGFDPKDAEKLFDLFERLVSPEEYEGTGVGLAIVKLVMDKHGGRVWAESTPGQGAVFHLAFPNGPNEASPS
jgi:signal transduction histidine kinase